MIASIIQDITLVITIEGFTITSIEISRHYAQLGATDNAVFEVSYLSDNTFSINNINTNLKLLAILGR